MKLKNIFLMLVLAIFACGVQPVTGATSFNLVNYYFDQGTWFGNSGGGFRVGDAGFKNGVISCPITNVSKGKKELAIVSYWYKYREGISAYDLGDGQAPYLRKSTQVVSIGPEKTVTVKVAVPAGLAGNVGFCGVLCLPGDAAAMR